MKKIICILIILSLFTGNTAYAKGTNYQKYSNEKKCWYFIRNKNHKHPASAYTPKQLKKYNAYYCDSNPKKKVIYLAFDCGYEAGYTKRILKTLKKNHVKATFFVTKAFVEENPGICKQMKKDGHIVGNHTMNHPSLPSKSISEIKNEVRGVEKLFKKKTGYKLDKFIRPPMGEYSTRVLKLLKDMGYKTIFWSIAYYDYDTSRQPGKQYVINHFKQYYHNGAITLTHNISSSNTEALNSVIKFLKHKKYKMKLLSDLK